MKEIQYPAIMGIWNISPDSFSSHWEKDGAASHEHALNLCSRGADIVDIGAESTRLGAAPLSSEEEISRLSAPITWARTHLTCPISLDSYHPKTIEWALHNEFANWINDIGQSESPSEQREGRIYRAVRDAGSHIVLMAWNDHKSPEDSFEICMKKIVIQLQKRLEFALKTGIDPRRIVVDPGIGFGKGLHNDLRLIAEAPKRLKPLGFPVLIAHSRKRCLSLVSEQNRQQSDNVTDIASAVAFSHGASLVRVHNPEGSNIARRMIFQDVSAISI